MEGRKEGRKGQFSDHISCFLHFIEGKESIGFPSASLLLRKVVFFYYSFHFHSFLLLNIFLIFLSLSMYLPIYLSLILSSIFYFLYLIEHQLSFLFPSSSLTFFPCYFLFLLPSFLPSIFPSLFALPSLSSPARPLPTTNRP